jgi:hypothetical protein
MWKRVAHSVIPLAILSNLLSIVLRSGIVPWSESGPHFFQTNGNGERVPYPITNTSRTEFHSQMVYFLNVSRPVDEIKASWPVSVASKRASSTIRGSTPHQPILADSMDQVVRMLMPKERAEEYIRAHPGKDFRFFVYETLPTNSTWNHFAKCLEEKYNVPDWYDHVKKGNRTSNCDWGSSLCTQRRSSSSNYSSRRFNRNGDVVLSKIFSEYLGPLRTFRPADAEIFIVPYAATAHCACLNERAKCLKVSDNDIKLGVLDHLDYFNASTRAKHVFLSSVQRDLNHPYMWRLPLVVTLEANQQLCKLEQNCGHVLQPYVNTNANYQPNNPQFIQTHESNSLEQRDYSIAAAMSGYIAADRRHQPRKEFILEMKGLVEQNQTVGGLPVFVSGLQRRVIEREDEILALYRRSIFCPCVRGDTPAQKRFFDVLLSGCIPVVLEFEESHEVGFPSFFREKGTSTRLTYPFSKGIFYDEPTMGIDYRDLSVSINGTCGIQCMIPTLDDFLLNHRERLAAIQRNIASLASLFTVGMENNALQYPDAVAGILVQIRHFQIHDIVL